MSDGTKHELVCLLLEPIPSAARAHSARFGVCCVEVFQLATT